jgi:hypothetical protein
MKALKLVALPVALLAMALVPAGAALAQGHGGGGGGGGEGGGCKDVLGDLIHILRDPDTGQPILARRFVELPQETPGYGWGYCAIALDANGEELGFLPYSCDVASAAAVVAVDYFGRLSGGRTKEKNSRMHFDEVISTIKMAGAVRQEPASGRLVLGFDCWANSGGQTLCEDWSAIDSPMENLALYTRLMKYGHLQTDPEELDIWWSGDPALPQPRHPALTSADWAKFHPSVRHLLPGGGSAPCFLADGAFAAWCAQTEALGDRDFTRAATFLAAAANKDGIVTIDLVQYMNRILKLTMTTETTLPSHDTLPALVRDCAVPGQAYVAPPEDDPAPVDPPYLPAAQCTVYPASPLPPNASLFADVRERFVDFGEAEYERAEWRDEAYDELILPTGESGVFALASGVDLMPWLAWANGPDPGAPEVFETAYGAGAFVEAASDALRTIEYIHNYAVPVDLWTAYAP